MKISFLIEVDMPLTKEEPTVKISCDSESIPQNVLNLAVEHFSAMAKEYNDTVMLT